MAIDPEQVKALFQAAFERGDPASRRAFLNDEIGDDDELPAYSIRTRGDDFAWQQNPWRVQWLSWPTLLVLAAIVAAASQLFGNGDKPQQALASQTMIASTGTVKALAFRPDGAMLLSVGVDGSMAIMDLAARRENPDRLQGVGRVRCAAFQRRQPGSRGVDRESVGLAPRSRGPSIPDVERRTCVDHGCRLPGVFSGRRDPSGRATGWENYALGSRNRPQSIDSAWAYGIRCLDGIRACRSDAGLFGW